MTPLLHALRRPWFVVAVLLVFASAGTLAGEPEKPSLDTLMATVDDAAAPGRGRADAAQAIAEHHYDPDTLGPWLHDRLGKEEDFHVRLALAYALAAQGEIEGLRVLIDSLQQTGHLGYVYLQRVSRQRIGGPGVGWDRPAWLKWLESLTPEGWKEDQRKEHLPRVATDADAAGLAKAIAWWDGLGLVDVTKLPFVRYTTGWVETGGDRRDTWSFGFLVKEDAASFTIFGTDLEEQRRLKKPPKGEQAYRFEPADLVQAVTAALQATEGGKGRGRSMGDDPFGVDYYQPPWRFQGFVLARALAAKGAQPLALKVWQHVAASSGGAPRQGSWSALALLESDTAARSYALWEHASSEPTRTWAAALEDFKRWRARFDKAGTRADDEAVLTTMAGEEAGYAAASAAAEPDLQVRAKRLVLALPNARGTTAAEKLVALGHDAVPALRAALDDVRFTRNLELAFGTKGWMRQGWRLPRVRELALDALREISQKDFGEGGTRGSADWKAIGAEVDAWWTQMQTKGEKSVLIEGVQAANAGSPAQARRLASKYPSEAFAPIRAAIEDASAEDVVVDLVKALAPLATPEVQAFLTERSDKGPTPVRWAAAQALHAQKRTEGITRLLRDVPALLKPTPVSPEIPIETDHQARALLEWLATSAPAPTLIRLREVLGELTPAMCVLAIDAAPTALGYSGFEAAGKPPSRPQPAAVAKEAEALVLALVLNEGERGGTHVVNGGEEANHIGELAAAQAARLWPKRYKYDAKAKLDDRVAQRYAMVNAWRATQKQPPLTPPGAPAPVAPTDPKVSKQLVDAWLAAAPGEARVAAEKALTDQGLGVLSALKSARKGLGKGDERSAALDLLVRRAASTLREVTWAKDGPKANPSFQALVDGLVGKPFAGKELLLVYRQLAKEPPEGALGVEVTVVRKGNGSGTQLSLRFTTEFHPWRGGDSGYILFDGGWELVDTEDLLDLSSWWHDTRAPQMDKVLLLPEDDDVRLKRTLTRGKG